MATTVATIIARAKRRFALDTSAADLELPDQLFIDRINEGLQEVAESGPVFREQFTPNLSGSTAKHTLNARVVGIIDGTLGVDYDGSGSYLVQPCLADEEELRERYGVIESDTAGVPLYYYTSREDAADAMLSLYLYPRSDTARTSGLRFWASCYPALLTSTSDNLPLQTGEERYLMPLLQLVCAEVQMNRGRTDAGAIVSYWRTEWERQVTRWIDIVENMQRGNRRMVHLVGEGNWGY